VEGKVNEVLPGDFGKAREIGIVGSDMNARKRQLSRRGQNIA
jgi:hypothetical protein